MKILAACVVFLAAAVPYCAVAEEATFSIIELSMNTGYYQFDSDSILDDHATVGWGLGLNFSERWAGVLQFSSLHHNQDIDGTGEVSAFNYHLDGMYFFRPKSLLRPYLVGGLGNLETEISNPGTKNEKDREFQLNGGAGIQGTINANWFFRTDCRVFYQTESGMTDTAAQFTIGYRFGDGE